MDISESVDRVLSDPSQEVASRFYANLFMHHPESAARFEQTDLKQQGIHLVMSLQVMSRHYRSPKLAMKNYLQVLGRKHCLIGVQPNDYQYFETALLTTLGAFHGPDWNAELASQWKEAFQQAIQLMLEGHADDFEVPSNGY